MIRRDLADLVFRACCAAGVVIGLLAGLHTVGHPIGHCDMAAHDCVGHGLAAGMTPVLIPSAIGAVGGACVGGLLALAIRRVR